MLVIFNLFEKPGAEHLHGMEELRLAAKWVLKQTLQGWFLIALPSAIFTAKDEMTQSTADGNYCQ